MPAEVSLGLMQFQQHFWRQQRELAAQARLAEAVAAARLDANKAGALEVLMALFLKIGSLNSNDVDILTEAVSESFVRKTWDLSNNPRKTESRYKPFLDALWRYSVIAL
jgi:hypothetical protein